MHHGEREYADRLQPWRQTAEPLLLIERTGARELQSPGEKYQPSRNSRPFFRLAFSSSRSNHVTLRLLPAASLKCAGLE